MAVFGYVYGTAPSRRQQQRCINAFCTIHDMHLVKSFSDGKSSGLSLKNRKNFNVLLSACSPGDVILVRSMESIFNSIEDTKFGIEIAGSKNLDVFIVDLNISLFKSELFIKTVNLLYKSRLVNSSGKLSGKLFSGGSRPFGYKIVNGSLQDIEEEQIIIRKIISLRKQGMSLRSIQEKLTENQIDLSHKAVQRILFRELEST